MDKEGNSIDHPRDLWNSGECDTAVANLANSSFQDDQFLAEHLEKLLQIVQGGLASSNPEQKSSLLQEAEAQVIMWLPTEWEEPQSYIELANQVAALSVLELEDRQVEANDGVNGSTAKTAMPDGDVLPESDGIEPEEIKDDVPTVEEDLPATDEEENIPDSIRVNYYVEEGREAYSQKRYQQALDAYRRACSLLEDAGLPREDVELEYYQDVVAKVRQAEKAVLLQLQLTANLQEIEELITTEQYSDALALCQELAVLEDKRVSQLAEEAQKKQQTAQEVKRAQERAEELEQQEKYDEALIFLSAWQDQPGVGSQIERVQQKQAARQAQVEDYIRQAHEAADKQDFSTAISLYYAALTLNPHDTRIQVERQQTEEALQLWQEIDDLLKEAQEDFLNGRWEQCEQKYREALEKDHEDWFKSRLDVEQKDFEAAIRKEKEESRKTLDAVIPKEKWPDKLVEEIRRFYKFPTRHFSTDELQKDQDQLEKAASDYLAGHYQFHLSSLLTRIGERKLETIWSELAGQVTETINKWKPIREDNLVDSFLKTANARQYEEVINALDEMARLSSDLREAAQTAPQIDEAITFCQQARKDSRYLPTAIAQTRQLLQERESDTVVASLLLPRYERLQTLQTQLEELQRSRLEKEIGADLILIEQYLHRDEIVEARQRLDTVVAKELTDGSSELAQYHRLDRWCRRVEDINARLDKAEKAYHQGKWQKLYRAAEAIRKAYTQTESNPGDHNNNQSAFVSPFYESRIQELKENALELQNLTQGLKRLDQYDEKRLLQPQFTSEELATIEQAVAKAWEVDAESEYVNHYHHIWRSMVNAVSDEIAQVEKLELEIEEVDTTRKVKHRLDQALEHTLVSFTLKPTNNHEGLVARLNQHQIDLVNAGELERAAHRSAWVDRSYREASLKLREAANLVLDFAPALSAKFAEEAAKYDEKEAYQQPFLERVAEVEQQARAGQLLEALSIWQEANRLFKQMPPDERNDKALEEIRGVLEKALLNRLRVAAKAKDYKTLTDLLSQDAVSQFAFDERSQEEIQVYRRQVKREQARQSFIDALSDDDLSAAQANLIDLQNYTDQNDREESQELTRWRQQYQAGEAVARAYRYRDTLQEQELVGQSVESLRTELHELRELEKTLLSLRDFYLADPHRLTFILETLKLQMAIKQAQLHEKEEKFEQAVTAYEAVARLNPDNPDWMRAANRIKETLKHYQAAKEAGNDQLEEALNHLAQIDLESRNWPQVEALCQDYLQRIREQGQLAEDIHDYQEALYYYQLVQKIEVTDEAYPRLARYLKSQLSERRRQAGLALNDYNMSADELTALVEEIHEAAKWQVEKPEDTEKWASHLIRELTRHKETIEHADENVMQAQVTLEQARENGEFQRVFDAFEGVPLRLKRQRNRVRTVYEATVTDRNRYERIRSAISEFEGSAKKLGDMDKLENVLSEQDIEQRLQVTREAWEMLGRYIAEA
ncbi:MAG: phage tail tape measure protein [Chloroflexi bacterium]|nr:phage tail tape measure protein [Chloroflexota bacterium]